MQKIVRRLLLIALLISTPVFSVSRPSGDSLIYPDIYIGLFEQSEIWHANGTIAWSGIFSDGIYSPATAFFHYNGILAWGGLSQTKSTWITDKAFFFYDNGQVAWGGLSQTKQSWTSEHGKFFHRNGELAWGGLDQNQQSWTSDNAKFYHSNGQLAWSGRHNSKVYYSNGRVAWEGQARSTAYDIYGKRMAIADYVYVHLGDNNWLFVSSRKEGEFVMLLNLGPGYELKVKPDNVVLELYGQIFDNL